MNRIVKKIDEWISREPKKISCVVVGKDELQELKKYLAECEWAKLKGTQMEDKYINKKIMQFHECKDNEEIRILINKIYEEGFEDGYNDKEK